MVDFPFARDARIAHDVIQKLCPARIRWVASPKRGNIEVTFFGSNKRETYAPMIPVIFYPVVSVMKYNLFFHRGPMFALPTYGDNYESANLVEFAPLLCLQFWCNITSTPNQRHRCYVNEQKTEDVKSNYRKVIFSRFQSGQWCHGISVWRRHISIRENNVFV
jgi:hypothetical protein